MINAAIKRKIGSAICGIPSRDMREEDRGTIYSGSPQRRAGGIRLERERGDRTNTRTGTREREIRTERNTRERKRASSLALVLDHIAIKSHKAGVGLYLTTRGRTWVN